MLTLIMCMGMCPGPSFITWQPCSHAIRVNSPCVFSSANCASSYLVKRNRDRHEDLDDERAIADERPEIDPEQRIDAAAERQRLTDALDALPPDMRAVVVLRDVYDLPHEAIAAELGISEAAAKVRLHRARRRLREQLFPMRGEEAARAG